MYSITQLKHFGLDPQKFAALSDTDKTSLLSARDTVIELLRAIEKKTAILPYVTADMAQKYKDSTGLAASLVAEETSLMAAGVTEFDFTASGRDIRLRFFVIAFSEGTLVVSEKTAIVRKSSSAWRVAGFE